MTPYIDYRFKFPIAGLALALQALAALRAADVIESGDLPTNMLGDARDVSGAIVSEAGAAAFIGRPGRPAMSYTDPDTHLPVNVPAAGDPNCWYVAIRSTTTPDQIPFDPSAYGLVPCSAAESAAVLGVWA